MKTLLTLVALTAFGSAHAQDAGAKAAPIDLPALIECRQSVSDFAALAPIAADPLKAVALGWRPLPQSNLFMNEYLLLAPITVFGHSSDHIAMAGATIVALLDMPDPRGLARTLELESAVDTAEKAMFGRELVSRDVVDASTGEALIESVILSVSNVKTHPGKTLAGCTYSLDLPADDEIPPAPAAAAASADQRTPGDR